MISAILFVTIALLLSGCALLGILGAGQLALSGVEAIERDGLARGRPAPAWSLADSAGVIRHSPPLAPLQLIVFADHSLKSFPSVVAGLRALLDARPEELRSAGAAVEPQPTGAAVEPQPGGAAVEPQPGGAAVVPRPDAAAAHPGSADLEIVIMLREPNEIAEPVLSLLGLAGIPVLTGSPGRYADYNVRVIPFAIFVDSVGRVRASSLINHDWQLLKLRQIAAIPIEHGAGAGQRPAELAWARMRMRRSARSRWQSAAQLAVPRQPGTAA